jgi:molybdate transport system substrate-binding protein
VALLIGVPAAAAEITVAVAANFQSTLARLAAAYEARSGDRIVAVPGATGALYAQIANGAPIDLFLAADTARPEKLEADGIAIARRTYALGRLALLDRGDASGTLMERLRDTARTIAIAKPEVAPYGQAAKTVLIAARGEAGWDENVVMGESVGQTFAYVATANAPLGFVALSQANAAGFAVTVTEVPAELHDPIRQDAALLTRAGEGARGFYDWLASPEARAIIESDGYATGTE